MTERTKFKTADVIEKVEYRTPIGVIQFALCKNGNVVVIERNTDCDIYSRYLDKRCTIRQLNKDIALQPIKIQKQGETKQAI